jgi:hypothetical protein
MAQKHSLLSFSLIGRRPLDRLKKKKDVNVN